MEEKVRQGEFDFGDGRAAAIAAVPAEPSAFLKEMAKIFVTALETVNRAVQRSLQNVIASIDLSPPKAAARRSCGTVPA